MYRLTELHFLTSCPNYTQIKDTFHNPSNTLGHTSPTAARRNLKPAARFVKSCHEKKGQPVGQDH